MFDNNYLFPFDTGLSRSSHLSHQSHIFARTARTPTRTFPKIFLFTLTLYLPYTNDTGRANEKRKIGEV